MRAFFPFLPIVFATIIVVSAMAQTQFLPNAKIERGTIPLIMEHADSLAAMRKAGNLLLQGKVRFRQDSVEFRTERARWDRNSDAVYADGGFDFRYPRGNIKADKGQYSRKTNIAIAEVNAVARDSSGKGEFFGEKIIYNRSTEFLEIPEKPLAHYYFNDKGKLDTLKIRSRTMTYNQREQLAVAADSVLITKSGVVITGDSGFYNQKVGFLSLKGTPKCTMGDYVITGDSMFVKLQNNEVESVLVIKNAHGMQETVAHNGMNAQHSEVFGDTLFLSVKNNKAQNLYVNVNAHGIFYERDLPEFINKMNGDRLDISFLSGNMRLAEIKGSASSLVYNITPTRKVDGRNESSGDTIFIAFDSSQVSRIKVKGNLASGIYYDLSKKP